MLKVDAEFIKRLHSGDVIAEPECTPERPWHVEKLTTFLTKLKAQTTHEAPVPGT